MKRKILVFLAVSAMAISLFPACSKSKGTSILYQDHFSLRITSKDGVVIFIDPYKGDGYDVPADIILTTQSHSMADKPAKKDDCVVITNMDALVDGEYKSFSIKGVEIEAVEAQNSTPHRVVGYIIKVDGFIIYISGETSRTDQMESFAQLEIDYAFFACHGGAAHDVTVQEAAECAKLVGAKHNIPYETTTLDFSREVAESFDAPNRLILEPGEVLYLEH